MAVIFAALAVACGTALGLGRGWLATSFALLSSGTFAAAFFNRQRSLRVAGWCALVGLGFAAGASASFRTLAEQDALLPGLATKKVVVDVCGNVQTRGPRSIQMRIERVEAGRSAWTTNEPLRVSGRKTDEARPGERLCAKGELRPPRPGRDEPPLLLADRVGERATSSVVRLLAAEVRSRFSDAARRALPKAQAGLLLGMTDGDTALLDEEIVEDFRTTGLAHIVAVSGYNVAVFLALVMVLVRALVARGRWLRVAVAVPTLIFFVFLTGLEPSVLRATLSAGVALVVGAGGRTTDALRAAALAFLVLLLLAPQLLFDIGFQLSFGATLGIILWGESLSQRTARLLRRNNRLTAALAAGLGTTIAAQIAVAPLLALHFGRIPGVGALANAVAIPLGGLIMLGGLLTLGAASLVPFLDWAPAMMRLPLDAILWSARAFANVPAASIAISAIAACALTGALVASVVQSPRVRAGALAFAVMCVGVAVGQARAGPRCDAPSIVALDVGQGSAVLLRSGEHAVLVDSGPADGGVVAQLNAAGVRRLDAIFLTHSHIDHAIGALDVLEAMDVDALVGPVHLRWTSGADVIRAAEQAGVAFEPKAQGDTYDAGDLHIDVLWPKQGDPQPFDETLVDVNSLVLRARVGGTSVLLPADIRGPQQKALSRDDIAVPILIAPHHGSKDVDPAFVEAVAPRITLITVGAHNPYGLPAPDAVRSYAARGAVFRTDQDGRVTVCLSPEGAEVLVER